MTRAQWSDKEFRRAYYVRERQAKLKIQYLEKSYSPDVDHRIHEHQYGVWAMPNQTWPSHHTINRIGDHLVE